MKREGLLGGDGAREDAASKCFQSFAHGASRPRRGIPSSPVINRPCRPSAGLPALRLLRVSHFKYRLKARQSKKSGQIGAQKLSTIKSFKNNNNTSLYLYLQSTHSIFPLLALVRRNTASLPGLRESVVATLPFHPPAYLHHHRPT